MSAKDWYKKRFPVYKAPSGTEYKLEIPDPISLIQFWIKECKIEAPLETEGLGKIILENPAIVAKTLIHYVKEPQLWEASSNEDHLNIKDFMTDQTDCIAILREVMSPFIDRTDELLEFFRNLQPSDQRGGTISNGLGAANGTIVPPLHEPRGSNQMGQTNNSHNSGSPRKTGNGKGSNPS